MWEGLATLRRDHHHTLPPPKTSNPGRMENDFARSPSPPPLYVGLLVSVCAHWSSTLPPEIWPGRHTSLPSYLPANTARNKVQCTARVSRHRSDSSHGRLVGRKHGPSKTRNLWSALSSTGTCPAPPTYPVSPSLPSRTFRCSFVNVASARASVAFSAPRALIAAMI